MLFRSTTRAASNCSVTGRVVRCAMGTIAPRSSKSVSLTLRASRAMRGMVFGLRASGANVPLVERKMDPTAERAPCAVAGRGLLTGSNVGENICGSAGNDRINGGDGDDFITGGAGNDRINGGGGNDMILAGTGADTADGGIGNDVITLDARILLHPPELAEERLPTTAIRPYPAQYITPWKLRACSMTLPC